MIKKSLIAASLILAVTLTLGLTGCGDAAGEAKTKAPVILTVTDLNGNEPYQASVTYLLEDEIDCTVRVTAIDPDPDISFYMDVLMKGYEISYDRKDTGSRVPETFTGNLSSLCEVDSTATFPIVICRSSQKEMPPLMDLCEPGYDQETGLAVIHSACRVVIWGDTFAGEQVVSKPAEMTVNFTCEWFDAQ